MTPAPLSALSDEQLSEAFALEVAGWTKPQPYLRIRTHDRISIVKAKCPTTGRVQRVPSYATSADAVLPYLEKHTEETGRAGGEPEVFKIFSPASPEEHWYIERWWLHHDGAVEEGHGVHDRTFPRAACCALIMAARARKGAA